MKAKTFVALILVLLFSRLATMAFTPVFDPSEARYAVMAANMARTGDFVVPHFTYKGVYQSFDGKPPLVFQAGGVFCRIFGVNEFSVRLFPFFCAILLGLILYHTVVKIGSVEKAMAAVLVYGSSAAFLATSGFAMTDGPLAVSVAGALLLYRCFLDRYEFKYALCVAVLLGAGMIVKGPVAFVLFGFPVFVDACVNNRWKAIFNVKWLYVLPVALLIAVPWFVLVEQRNPGAVEYFFVNENFRRFLYKEYGDKYGAGRETFRGMALVWTFLATLPWALIPIWNAVKTRAKPVWRDFAFLSISAITFFWCLPSHTLLSYLLPVTPLFATYIALTSDERPLLRLSRVVVPVVAVGLMIGLFVAPSCSTKMLGAKAPDFYGFSNRYSHEFYYGTDPRCVNPDPNLIPALQYEALQSYYQLEHSGK